jgi:FG-GAP-like repeat/Salmonella virulence plasmid 65kDa B protein
MAPKLELVYNSQQGNGMFGLGWGVSGLSSITRCAQTPAQDGNRGLVKFDTGDRFCLDGQRLMLFSGTYGATGSEYRTEMDSFSQIKANGSANNGPVSFTVKTKDGLIIEYGNTADSRIEALKAPTSLADKLACATAQTMRMLCSPGVRAWAQNKVTDLSGNYMTVSYDEDSANGAYYPSRIDYTGNIKSSPVLATTASVQFQTEASRLDAVPGYWAGAAVKSIKRVNAIRTYVGTALTKEYRLAYVAQSTTLDKSKLSSITECDGVSNCLAPTTLTWGGNGTDVFAVNTGLAAQYGTNQGWSDNNKFPRFMVDVNGDGLADIVGFGNGGVYVSHNNGNGFDAASLRISGQYGTAQGWTDNRTYPRMVVDVNGDGYPDIVGFGPSGIYVATNYGDGTFAPPQAWLANQYSPSQGWADNEVNPRMLVDVNGDGRPDVVGFSNGGVVVSLNNAGTGFVAPGAVAAKPVYACSGAGSLDYESQPPQCYTYSGGGPTGGNAHYYPATIASYTCTSGTLSGASCILPGNATSSWAVDHFGTLHGWANQTTSPRYLVDVNGDGLPDIVGFTGGGVVVSLNTGVGFVAFQTVGATPVYDCNPGDSYNSDLDGCYHHTGHDGGNVYSASILSSYTCTNGMVSGSRCIISTSNAVNWSAAQFGGNQGWTDNSVTPRYWVDVNADGLTDIVGFGPNGVVVALNTGAGFAVPAAWLSSQFSAAQVPWADNNVTPRHLADVNGDGFPDIVGFGTTGVMVALNTGTGFTAPANWYSNFGSSAGGWVDNKTYPRFVVDINGDGLPDIIGFSSTAVMVATDARSMLASFVGSISNGMQAVISPTFASLTKSSSPVMYTKDTGSTAANFPRVDITAPFYVVNTVASSNGIGSTNTTTYSYGGLKTEVGAGRGMLGFRWVKSQEPTPVSGSAIERYTEYRQDWPFVGMPSLSETRLVGAGGTRMLKQNTVTALCQGRDGAACTVAPLGIYFPYVSQTIESAWDTNGAVLPVTTTTYLYEQNPQFGDPTTVGVAINDGFSATTVNTYTPADTANWLAPRLQNATVTTTKP